MGEDVVGLVVGHVDLQKPNRAVDVTVESQWHGRIVGETVEVVLVFAPQCEAIDPFSQQLGGRVTDLFGMARIMDLFGQRFNESQSMIGLPKQDSSGMRSDSLLGCLNLDSPIEFRFE